MGWGGGKYLLYGEAMESPKMTHEVCLVQSVFNKWKLPLAKPTVYSSISGAFDLSPSS